MGVFIVFGLIEILSVSVLRQHFYLHSKLKYYISIFIHSILSLWFWILFFETTRYNSFFDTPDHIWMLMSLAGMVTAVIFPRIILISCHFSGKLAKISTGGHIRWLTNSGLIFSVVFFIIIALGTLHGRFNFRNEFVTIKVKGLSEDLDGLKIVQISDLHLSGFYHHTSTLRDAITRVNSFQPDIIVNTGDFISFGWREFGRNDTILSRAKSKYGNFAIMGNHDVGTYNPDFTEADIDNNILIMNNLIKSSGYTVLNDDYTKIRIGRANLALIGITTRGRHPYFTYGDLKETTLTLDSSDLKILLAHDPNEWLKEVSGKTDIEITLSGHTHGMQMGIMTKNFKWSPSKYFYPHWNGLYTKGNQMHYVNRGLGVLAIPFRIWMPPEITIITIQKE